MIGPIIAEDAKAGFRSGVHPLDDYLKRHAVTNDRAGISRCFVPRPEQAGLPSVSGFVTIEGEGSPRRMFLPIATAKTAADASVQGA